MRMMSTRKKPKRRSIDKYSPASLIIKAHYNEVGVNKVWNRNRIQRLIGYLRITEEELVSLLNTNISAFKASYLRGSVTGPCALILTVLEATYMSEFIKDSIPDIFNFYGTSRYTEKNRHDPAAT
jgi:hypothetical protein